MQRYTFDKAARKWVKFEETPKRVTRKRKTAETKEVKAENK